MMTKLIICILINALCVREIFAGKKLILVCIDGFRWDYLDDPMLDLKGIPKIIENGVHAPYVNPVYPSLTYPNTYTIVTGLYPENHGIINNIMYDKETGEKFFIKPKNGFLMFHEEGGNDEHWWDVAEPIWVTAEKQNKYVAMYWWVGCEVKIKGIEPMICERARFGSGTEAEKNDYFARIDDIIQLFKPPDMDRLSLAMIYYGALDYRGHYWGPGSAEARKSIQDMDDVLNKLLQEIEEAGLQDEVNIMVVSDHGMTNILQNNKIDLERFVPSIKYQVGHGAAMMLVPEDGMLDKLYNELKQANIKGLQIYKKEEIPDSFHLKKSPRVNDIFLKAEKGYIIQSLKDPSKVIGGISKEHPGEHGFHPDEVPDMRTIFFATGPGFRKGVTSKPLTNTDHYNIMCTVLGIQPLPNNGSMERVQGILSEDSTSTGSLSSSVSLYAHNSILFFFSLYLLLSYLLNKYY